MCLLVFFFKQKTAYEMRISDWSSDVCSSDLAGNRRESQSRPLRSLEIGPVGQIADPGQACGGARCRRARPADCWQLGLFQRQLRRRGRGVGGAAERWHAASGDGLRSEEHTSELQSLMRISYAVFCLKKKKGN